jgi:uncharacterized protein YndB with AHSA1/START domain
MRLHIFRSLAISGSLLSLTARADVVEATANGMQIRHVVAIAAPAATVYSAFLKVERWWDKEHTYSGDAANLTLAAAPGGCFCEKLPEGGGAVHLTVVNVAPNKRMTLTGALGPLQTTGVTGALSFSFVPKASGSQIVMVYNVGGYYPNGLQSVAGAVDDVLLHQLQRLKDLVETGNADRAATNPAAN